MSLPAESIDDEDLEPCIIAGVEAKGILVRSDVTFGTKEAQGRVTFPMAMPKEFCSNVTYYGALIEPENRRLVDVSVYLSPVPKLIDAGTDHEWTIKGISDLLWKIQTIGAPTEIESIKET